MNNRQIISALIGLAGAVSNNSKSASTDEVVRNALLSFGSELNESDVKTLKTSKTEEEIVELIHKEKFRISPNCETCQFPCGNTSDYDMERFDESEENIKHLKEKLINAMCNYLQKGNDVTDMIYRGISYLGYELDESTYENLINKINESSK